MSTNSEKDAEFLVRAREAIDSVPYVDFGEPDVEGQAEAVAEVMRAVAAAAWDEALAALLATNPAGVPCPIPEDCANPMCKLVAKVAELPNPYSQNALVVDKEPDNA